MHSLYKKFIVCRKKGDIRMDLNKQLNKEVILFGHVISGLFKVRVNNKEAVKLLLRVEDDNDNNINHNIPVYFVSADYKMIESLRNNDIGINGHLETKWRMRIIVDAVASLKDEQVFCRI